MPCLMSERARNDHTHPEQKGKTILIYNFEKGEMEL